MGGIVSGRELRVARVGDDALDGELAARVADQPLVQAT
jgi:hypothetical protein